MSEINSSVENYEIKCKIKPTINLSLINPVLLSDEYTSSDIVPSIIPAYARNKFRVRSMIYDEDVIFEETPFQDLKCQNKEIKQDNYDDIYIKIINKNLQNFCPPESPMSDIINLEFRKSMCEGESFHIMELNEFKDKFVDENIDYIMYETEIKNCNNVDNKLS